MEKGNIIILNGVSSAGKSTLAKTLQERLSEPYFHMDVDVFCLMSPEKFGIDGDYSVQWKFVSNMFHAVKLFSDMGFNLVVPCVCNVHTFTVRSDKCSLSTNNIFKTEMSGKKWTIRD